MLTAAATSASRLLCLQILYYDGQFDDARLNVMLATTAAAAGAAIANYVEATGLIKVRQQLGSAMVPLVSLMLCASAHSAGTLTVTADA